MECMNNFFTWMKNNRVWVFGSIGIVILALFFIVNTSSKESMTDMDTDSKATNNIEVSDDGDHDSLTDKELVIEIDGDKIYPTAIDMMDEQKVGVWVYFRYMLEETYNNYTVDYPVLLRYKEGDHIAKRVNKCACYSFEIVGEYLYYLDSTMDSQAHGVLYVSRLDGTDERLLEEELYDFQIVDEKYIYYTYSYDTIGVGLEGHALHRMNLDGSEKMIAAYEVSGIDMGQVILIIKLKMAGLIVEPLK